MRLDAACSHIVDCEHKTAPIDESGDFFAVGTPAMKGHRINYADARRISRETFEQWTRRLKPAAGDLLLAREAPVGPVVQLPRDANVAAGQRTVLLRPDPQVSDSRFLYYALSSPASQAALQIKAEGSTVHHLNVPDIRSFDVRIPPLGEQRAIAEVLGALDDKIAANTALATSLYALIEAEFEQAMRLAASERKLSALVTTQYGVTASATEKQGGIRFLRVTDINKRPWVDWPGVPSCDLGNGDERKYLLAPGDIVVARMADPGKCAWIAAGDPVAVFASYLVRVRALDPAQAPYIFQFLRSSAYLRHVDSVGQGSVQKNMNAKAMVATSIPLPDADVLGEFGSRFRRTWGAMTTTLRESQTLAATRDALLPHLMSGKLRVRDAERIAAEAGA